ncbi:Na+/H+ antiporter NhaC family protein [soil metagenome]
MIRSAIVLASLLLLLLPRADLRAQGLEAAGLPTVDAPAVMLPGTPVTLTAHLPEDAASTTYSLRTAAGREVALGELQPGQTQIEGVAIASSAELPLALIVPGRPQVTISPRYLPGWISVVPPLLAILLALIFREVVISLFAGVWLGAFLWTGFEPFGALLRTVDTFALPALADSDHAAIIMFSLMIGGMVGVIGRNGGTFGIVERLSPIATTPRRGQLATYAQGLAIFFDDYANTLIVGNTMRPVTDRLKVSREKLAYIVDSTAAPIASIVFVSTWVGYEISLIADGLRAAAAAVATTDPALAARLEATSAFNVFIDTIPYRFYPLLALTFVLMVIWSGRDFGPMRAAEARAASGGGVHRPGAQLLTDTTGGSMEPPAGAPLRWWNAAVPVLVVVFTVLFGLYFSGLAALPPGDYSLRDVIGEANSFHVLLWASLLGSVAAILLTVIQRILTLQETMDAWLSGIRSMVLAMVILVLAWSLGRVTEFLGTAQFISSALEGSLPVEFLPVLVFAAAAGISFATGTSWGTMAILLPLVIPLGASLTVAHDLALDGHYTILLGVTSSVLAGSIFGDHCSPISDTSVMSSMASACDHMDHVRTQLPYALVVAAVGMAVGDIPTAYGLSPWVSLAIGVVILWLALRFFGRRTSGLDTPLLTPREAQAEAHGAV